jgi:hypothetical protein
MNKIVIGVLISFMMLGSVLAGANTVNYSSEGTDSISLFEIGDGEIKVTFPLGDYEIISSEYGEEIFLENFGRNLIPGKPNLPSKIFSVAIPPGAIFKDVSYTYGEKMVLEDIYNIQPVVLPRVIGEEDPEIYKQDLIEYNENYESTYGKNEQYPLSVVEFVRTSGFRKYNLVDIRVNPFSYNPISKKLTFYPEVTALISYTFEDGFTYDDIMIDYNEKTKKVAEKIVHNYDIAKDWYPEGADSKEMYDYVIITLDSLTSSVQSLVDWEEEKGRSVNVVTTYWINSYYSGYDLAEKIRNFLRHKYPSEEWGILDVCLIGNYDDVPMRRTWQSVGGKQPETDYYYADLSYPDEQSWDLDVDRKWGETYDDQIDFTAEINVGRIPFSDPSIVENICEKSVSYEMNNNPSFKRNILLLGSFFWNDDPNPRTDNAVLMEYKTNPELHPWMSKWKMTRMYEEGYTTYPMDYNLNWTNVKDVWSSGSYAFVNYAGHGSPDACWLYFSHGSFVNTDTCYYLNDDYPSIVFADACSNSDTDHFNLGQAMMQQGAVGFLGATKVAYGMPGWDDPTDGSSQTMDYLFTVSCTSGEYTQGQAHQYALREMYVNGYWYKEHLETFEWGALWGNPDISMANVIENEPPSVPVIDGPSSGSPGIEYCWTFQSIDLEGDKIMYIIDWGDENISETDCDNPNSTIELCHTYAEKGYYNIKAKAVDCENGFESDWSNPKLFVVPRERVVQYTIFERILQRLIHLFPLFERLII